MADSTNHWRAITSEAARWRPSCTCGWKGRLSQSTDQAAGQFSGHMARLSTAALAAAGVRGTDEVTDAEVDAALQRHCLIPTDISRADMRRTLEQFLSGRTHGVPVSHGGQPK